MAKPLSPSPSLNPKPPPPSSSVAPPQKRRRVKVSGDVVYRIIVPRRRNVKLFGNTYFNINKVRHHTKTRIIVADRLTDGFEDRVILIKSKDSDDAFCAAEEALHRFVTLILMDEGSGSEAHEVGATHEPANEILLLISGCQMSSLIGINAQNIEKLRYSSGANIAVLAQNQLPFNAAACEGDRIVQIWGNLPNVIRAVVEISCHLRENPPKQVVTISPCIKQDQHRPYLVDPSSAEYVSMDMMIPEALVGGLIGDCGSSISRIRSEAGVTMKVYDSKSGDKQSQIHLAGDAQQVALAKRRIDEYVSTQLMLRPGGSILMPDESNAFQGDGQGHELYANSNPSQSGMIASLPPDAPDASMTTNTPSSTSDVPNQ